MQIALAINKIIGVDVVIIDDHLARIADTFRYSKDRIIIRKESIVGRIIESGRPLAIDDKMVFRSCIDCPDFSACRMQSLIGVPIICNGKTVGAIALAISPRHRKELFGNLAHTVGFLEKMAEMLAGKLQSQLDYNQLSFAKSQREVLMDAIEDGLVSVSHEGRIVYYNKAFDKLFLQGHSVLDTPLANIITHPQIGRYFENRQPFRNKLIYCESRYGSFDGYITVVPFTMDGAYHGAVFTFRRINSAGTAATLASRHFTPENILGTSRQTTKLRKQITLAAQNNEAVLLEGAPGVRRQELARCIHNTSSRKKGNFFIVNCQKSNPSELEEELFGTPEDHAGGKIRLAHKGTLCLHDVEYLPLYLQRRICDYLVRGTVVISNGETVSDARLILTSAQNLEKLAAEGLFNDLLYDRVCTGRIAVPALSGQPADLQEIFIHYIRLFEQHYRTNQLEVEPEVLDAMYAHEWKNDIPHLRFIAEYLVKTSRNGKITLSQLPQHLLLPTQQENTKAVSEFVKEQICGLLAEGKSYEEIAATLQISRATLYRKLKKYNINRKELYQ